jgi:hypothetical protein
LILSDVFGKGGRLWKDSDVIFSSNCSNIISWDLVFKQFRRRGCFSVLKIEVIRMEVVMRLTLET